MGCFNVVISFCVIGVLIFTGCANQDLTEINLASMQIESLNSISCDDKTDQKTLENINFILVQDEKPASSADSPEKVEPPKETPQTAPSAQKVMFDAYFNIGLYDADKIKEKIIASAIAKGGYLQQEGNLNLVIHVPSKNFQEIADEISNYGRIIEKNVYSRDVSESFIDLTTQAKVKNESLLTLREMLKKTETKEDMLAVLKEIRYLQDEIDAVEGQRRYIQARVDKSVIKMDFRLEQQMVAAPSKVKLPIDWLYRHGLEFLMEIR